MAKSFYKTGLISGLVILCLLSFSPISIARTMYVTETFQITFRAGKGTGFKILQLLSSGMPVEIISQEDEWSQVELENGQTGWVLSRYLMEGPPQSMIIEQLNKELQARKSRIDTLLEENNKLKSSNRELTEQAASLKNNWEEIRRNYEELLEGSSEYLAIKKKHESLNADMNRLTGQLQLLRKDNEKLKEKTRLYWFLAGSLVLLLGLIIGITLGRLQRKKKMLYP